MAVFISITVVYLIYTLKDVLLLYYVKTRNSMIVVLNGLCHIVGWRISVVDFYLGESGNSYFNTGVEISMDQFYSV